MEELIKALHDGTVLSLDFKLDENGSPVIFGTFDDSGSTKDIYVVFDSQILVEINVITKGPVIEYVVYVKYPDAESWVKL